ncbi:hypothetical protein M440DRAFT_326009 [Trichoderma longibrachiatum ATCC 18648]|uniref:Uncharacterized protein n=1 Tax=Trichoderma longibrachiatum ATCC 18648 TaxID=983965 RepID=A0A2T4C218_TRILO|nr:hypothetical protein M440DRAFT_326009 [Trichoderma longibrachiatum ATCC 18648]
MRSRRTTDVKLILDNRPAISISVQLGTSPSPPSHPTSAFSTLSLCISLLVINCLLRDPSCLLPCFQSCLYGSTDRQNSGRPQRWKHPPSFRAELAPV